jgi:hypothetical protein
LVFIVLYYLWFGFLFIWAIACYESQGRSIRPIFDIKGR